MKDKLTTATFLILAVLFLWNASVGFLYQWFWLAEYFGLIRWGVDVDIYVPECNTGSAFAGCKRMDGWAMKKSWANPLTLGYEIKVTRQDFLRDDKWPNYLPVCNQLYFVVAHGIERTIKTI